MRNERTKQVRLRPSSRGPLPLFVVRLSHESQKLNGISCSSISDARYGSRSRFVRSGDSFWDEGPQRSTTARRTARYEFGFTAAGRVVGC